MKRSGEHFGETPDPDDALRRVLAEIMEEQPDLAHESSLAVDAEEQAFRSAQIQREHEVYEHASLLLPELGRVDDILHAEQARDPSYDSMSFVHNLSSTIDMAKQRFQANIDTGVVSQMRQFCQLALAIHHITEAEACPDDVTKYDVQSEILGSTDLTPRQRAALFELADTRLEGAPLDPADPDTILRLSVEHLQKDLHYTQKNFCRVRLHDWMSTHLPNLRRADITYMILEQWLYDEFVDSPDTATNEYPADLLAQFGVEQEFAAFATQLRADLPRDL